MSGCLQRAMRGSRLPPACRGMMGGLIVGEDPGQARLIDAALHFKIWRIASSVVAIKWRLHIRATRSRLHAPE